MTPTQIVKGSLTAISQQNGQALAELFLSAETIVLVDTSGSMEQYDGRIADGTRYKLACNELARLQMSLPGKVAVMAFSDRVTFCPGGVPEFFGRGTDLAGALAYAHTADDCGIDFIVISDGAPDSAADALAQASRFLSKISTIYIGPEGGQGQAFLAQLAAASGGQSVNVSAALLGSGVRRLLEAV